MSKSKHTAGPWVSRPTASLGPQYVVHPEEDGPDIAIIYDHGNATANARLITACPELLQALRELERITRHFISGELVSFPAALLPQCRNVIAKAEAT